MYGYNELQAVKNAATSAIDVARGYNYDEKARPTPEILTDLAKLVLDLDENAEDCSECDDLRNEVDAAEERANDAEYETERKDEELGIAESEKDELKDRVEEYRLQASKLAAALRAYDAEPGIATPTELSTLIDAMREVVEGHDAL